jgi:hypothetical protein
MTEQTTHQVGNPPTRRLIPRFDIGTCGESRILTSGGNALALGRVP